jgi:hypothetical protein
MGSTDRGFPTAHWTFQGLKHCVISDVNAQEFDAVAKAVQQLDTARVGSSFPTAAAKQRPATSRRWGIGQLPQCNDVKENPHG